MRIINRWVSGNCRAPQGRGDSDSAILEATLSKSLSCDLQKSEVPISPKLGTPFAFHTNSNGFQNHCKDVGAAQSKTDWRFKSILLELPSQHEEII